MNMTECEHCERVSLLFNCYDLSQFEIVVNMYLWNLPHKSNELLILFWSFLFVFKGARNALETFVIDMQTNIYTEQYEKAVTEEEKENILKTCSEVCYIS